MKKVDRKQRLGLTLLFTAIVFCFFLITLVTVGLVIFVLVRLSLLTGIGRDAQVATHTLLIFGISGLLMGSVMTFFFSRIPLKPVNTLINLMNRLATGDYSARCDMGPLWRRHSSVAEIELAFNRMASELEGTEMLRSDFINNFSHEFKTPIVSITGFAKLLKRGNLSETQKAEYLDIIEAESLRLSQMATNVLDLTKIENQTILTNTSTYNLSEQLRTCILMLTAKWEKKHLEFSVEFDEHTVFGNRELLQQVWINLLDNAIKFSEAYGTITVSIAQQPDSIAVSVANEGPPIPPEERRRIFNKFYQADHSHSTEGNGVGLAVVKYVTELHGGTVAVDCQYGRTIFTVCLPIHTA